MALVTEPVFLEVAEKLLVDSGHVLPECVERIFVIPLGACIDEVREALLNCPSHLGRQTVSPLQDLSPHSLSDVELA
jgi:hypothetical protein